MTTNIKQAQVVREFTHSITGEVCQQYAVDDGWYMVIAATAEQPHVKRATGLLVNDYKAATLAEAAEHLGVSDLYVTAERGANAYWSKGRYTLIDTRTGRVLAASPRPGVAM